MGCGASASARKYEDPSPAAGSTGGSCSSTAEPPGQSPKDLGAASEATSASSPAAHSIPCILVTAPSASEEDATAEGGAVTVVHPGGGDAVWATKTAKSGRAGSKERIRAFDEGRIIIKEKKPLTDFYHVDLVKDKLADGEFGAVCKVTNKQSGKVRMAKSLRKKKAKLDWMKDRLAIHSMLDHPNLCVLYEVYDDRMNYYMVFDLCTGGFLFEVISEAEEFAESDACHIIRQVLKAVAYLHQSSVRVCHRDICPENILVQEPVETVEQIVPKLIDFGKARIFEEGEMMEGDPRSVVDCMSPQATTGPYSALTDVWSCGVILYGLLCGRPPFTGSTEEKIWKRVQNAREIKFDPGLWSTVSEEAKELVKLMLAYEEANRVSAQQALEQAWFKDTAQAKVSLKKDQWQSLSEFGRRNKLHRAALNAVAQRLGHEDINELRRLFESLDSDHSGTLSVEELKSAVADFEGKKEGKANCNLQAMIEAIDVNGSQEVNYTEFIAAALDRRHLQEEGVLWTAFRHFDKDNSGSIDRTELGQILHSKEVEEIIDQTCVDRVMTECDFNGDGRIDFQEFLCMMRGEQYDPAKHGTEEEQGEADPYTRTGMDSYRTKKSRYSPLFDE